MSFIELGKKIKISAIVYKLFRDLDSAYFSSLVYKDFFPFFIMLELI